jgi:hypothetical protein
MAQMNERQDNQKWSRSRVFILLLGLLVIGAVYWVLYIKLTPLREFSGLQEQAVPLGSSAGNH